MLWISGADNHDPAAQLPSYHYFKMLIDPSYEPPLVAQFDDEGATYGLRIPPRTTVVFRPADPADIRPRGLDE